MRAIIIKIGNSQGVRIPKPLLEQTGLEAEVDIKVEENRLVISPVHSVRWGWAEAFRDMAARGDDALLDSDRIWASQWDEGEWEWK